jgi:NTE family protein
MDTALVLGGGGVTGIAWEWGMLAGLAEAGVDVTGADLVVGTSAGSVVGAQVASGIGAEERYAAQLADPGGELAARLAGRLWVQLAWTILRSRDPERARARLGRMALGADTVPEAERRHVIESRLPVRTWPERRLIITAVDAHSGEFITFDRDSGVPLVDAVGASCAVPGIWPPVTINGRRYIDGGVCSAANADLAAGYRRVVVLAPITTGFGPVARLATQVAKLEKQAHVVVVSPDRAARRAIGRNLLDPARRAAAAKAGRAQAAKAAESIAAVWTEPTS